MLFKIFKNIGQNHRGGDQEGNFSIFQRGYIPLAPLATPLMFELQWSLINRVNIQTI